MSWTSRWIHPWLFANDSWLTMLIISWFLMLNHVSRWVMVYDMWWWINGGILNEYQVLASSPMLPGGIDGYSWSRQQIIPMDHPRESDGSHNSPFLLHKWSLDRWLRGTRVYWNTNVSTLPYHVVFDKAGAAARAHVGWYSLPLPGIHKRCTPKLLVSGRDNCDWQQPVPSSKLR